MAVEHLSGAASCTADGQSRSSRSFLHAELCVRQSELGIPVVQSVYVDNKEVVPGKTLSEVLNSVDPDLSEFRERGGKLIQYHGFSDPEVPPLTSINYFESAATHPGESLNRIHDFYRLFMVPGMNHCQGGPGANVFDMLTPLDQWVEQDSAPDRILATHYVNNDPAQGVALTRPLCSYPQEATYVGGNPNDAANFVCQ